MVTRAGFNGDIEISGDSSISRCHAEIFLIKEVNDPSFVVQQFITCSCYISGSLWQNKSSLETR